MKRGPKPTTLRGRAAGGVEVRAWVSAEEYARVSRAARAMGKGVSEYVRDAALAGIDDQTGPVRSSDDHR